MRSIFMLATLALLAASATAQERPTLSGVSGQVETLETQASTLETQVQDLESEKALLEARVLDLENEKTRTRDAICAAADVAGESYRPFVCEARCDCLPGNAEAYTSCAETSAGEFTIGFDVDFGVCEAFGCAASTACFTSSGSPCIGGGACPAGETCQLTDPFDPFSAKCLRSCTTDADCPSVGICELGGGQVCTADTDCEPGETCQVTPTSVNLRICSRSCDADVDCTGPTTGSLVGVASADATGPVTCSADLVLRTVNTNDALECLAEVGTALGSPCASICGNGEVGPGEQCDDGNATPGDGCDASCQVEP